MTRTPCPICGAEKAPGRGQRYCLDCAETRRWKADRKRATRAVIERQPCERCGARKQPGRGQKFCAACAAAAAVTGRACPCGAQIEAPARLCLSCRMDRKEAKKIAGRERYRRLRREGKLKPRKPVKRSAAHLETVRLSYRMRQDEAGRELRAPRGGWYSDRRVDLLREISVDPLLPLLRERLRETTVTDLGEVAHVRPYTISAIMDGNQATVTVPTADRLAVALGLPFSLLYRDVA